MGTTLLMLKKHESYKERLDVYFEGRAARGLGVPESPQATARWGWTAIMFGTGIPLSILRSAVIDEHIRSWSRKIGFSPAELQGGGGPVKARDYEKKANAYLTRLRESGRKLPENPRCIGRLDWERVAEESGLPVATLSRPSATRGRIQKATLDLGMAIYREYDAHAGITYCALLRDGTAWREDDLAGCPNAKQQVYNTRTQLRRFMRLVGGLPKQRELKESDLVGGEMLEHYEETMREITPLIANKGTRRKFAEEMQRWASYLEQMLRSAELPRQFIPALETALLRAGMSVSRLGAEAGVKSSKIQTWLNGTNNPSRETFPEVRRLEAVLLLPPNTLTSRIITRRTKHFPSSTYPEYVKVNNERIKVRDDERVIKFLRPLLPDDYDERDPGERLEMVTWLVENLILPTSEWGRWQRSIKDAGYRLKDVPQVVQEEWEGLEEFKCARLAPSGKKRNGVWSGFIAEMYKSDLLRMLGFLALKRDAADARLRGPGLDPNVFTLAMLTCEELVEVWLRWRAERRGKHEKVDGKKAESYSTADLRFVQVTAGLLHPETGWFTQTPSIARHLQPISGFIDDVFVERARRDWAGVCRDAYTKYKLLAESLEDVVEEQRDPFEPILSLLDLDHPQYHNPISALRTFARNVIDDLPDLAVTPFYAATHLRNYLIVRLLAATALRSRNLRELTYREDNTGHLRRKGDRWVIEIPWQSFKNKHSSFFGTKKKKHNYEKVLTDKDGLYGWIEKYIAAYRPVLLGDQHSDIFLVATSERPLMTASTFSDIYHTLTIQYFVHNPYLGRGVPGVKPHGPHAIRDMIATFIMQQTGSYDFAAYAIGDSAQTVREHYARFMPKDKTRLVEWVISRAWDGDVDGPSVSLTSGSASGLWATGLSPAALGYS